MAITKTTGLQIAIATGYGASKNMTAVSNASEGVVQLAESLVRNKFAIIESIESGLTDLDDASNETGTRKGIKFVVKLKKSDEFDELTKNLPPPEK